MNFKLEAELGGEVRRVEESTQSRAERNYEEEWGREGQRNKLKNILSIRTII